MMNVFYEIQKLYCTLYSSKVQIIDIVQSAL